MAKKVPLDKLQSEIDKILDEYKDQVTDGVQDAVAAVTKAGAKAVKAEAQSKFNGTGKYAKGWTSKVEKDRLGAQGVIYNKAAPGLPHLLEKGHAKRGGGRTQGRPHIKPVEEKINKEFEEKVVKAI